EMLSFPGDCLRNGIQFSRIVDFRGFEHVEFRKQKRVGKGALAPLNPWIVWAMEQQIVDGGPHGLTLVIRLSEPCGDGIWRNPRAPADPIIHAFGGKSCCREC